MVVVGRLCWVVLVLLTASALGPVSDGGPPTRATAAMAGTDQGLSYPMSALREPDGVRDEDLLHDLHEAVCADDASVAAALLSRGMSVESCELTGPPLGCAAASGSLRVARLLLSRGADVNGANHLGETPLHFAAGQGMEPMVRLLVAWHADVDRRDWLGQTPLTWAAQGGQPRTVQALLAAGASVNCCDDLGRTPLMVAQDEGHGPAAALLMACGGRGSEQARPDPREVLRRAKAAIRPWAE